MMVRLFLALIALPLLGALSPPTGAEIFDGRPDAVVCPLAAVAGRPGGLIVFHLD